MNTTTQVRADGADGECARLVERVRRVCEGGALGAVLPVISQSMHPNGVVEIHVEEPTVMPDPLRVYGRIRTQLTTDVTKVGRTLHLRFCTENVAIHQRSFVRDVCFILLAIFTAIATGVWLKHGN